ncbi:hypothetical protein GCM10008024_19810 [Allgaiera indica]|uniref:Exopolysaccharide production protein ExoY n=1 Tax=Allgaiera indica TaxID=765699 RepID=A0AAN4UR74_9RHOB|nr:sugar transferase [Allgaiera indica]GHE01992.1 hypothetical protein GCM10008024_19810 [Allgaiera indica]SDX03047.1 exopolysaccharide production protein ExoY [Allgaiera indica]
MSKRVFDRLFAALLLVFFAPFLILVAVVLLVTEGRPILFGHTRVGRGGQPFRCLKFRTMVPDAEARLQRLLDSDPAARQEWAETHKLSQDPRVSCVGHFLRRTSLDELPQLFNVLRGEMSLVGPRPIVEDESIYYGQHFADYLSVRPGLTGAWQVSGRSTTTYAQRVAIDVAYVRGRSFVGDLCVLFRTVRVVLLREGAV